MPRTDAASTTVDAHPANVEAAAPLTGSNACGIITSRAMKLPLDPAILTRRQQHLLRSDDEDGAFDAVPAQARPEDVGIEPGACIATRRKARAQNAHEANPRMIPGIRAVHRTNGVEHSALSDAVPGPEAGIARLPVRAEFPDASLIEHPDKTVRLEIAVVEVPMLDIAAEFCRMAPTFMNCDIEGAETELIPADLSSLRCAVLELHPQWIGKSGVQAVFDAMHRAGLSFYPRTSMKKVVTLRRDW